MIIGISGNFNKKDTYPILRDLGVFLSSKNITFYILEDKDIDFSRISSLEIIKDFKYISNNCDIIISIGGDGTIISTIRKFIEFNKPILGLHIGGLGFLAECSTENYKDKILDLISNKYFVEERMLLKVETEDTILHAINELVINRVDSVRTIKVNLDISNKYANSYESDGIIFSTPTGSTAYSLSAGGPIIYPTLSLFAITPICSHTLSMRPLIISSEELIKISFDKNSFNKKVSLTVDGQKQKIISNDSEVFISKSNYIANIIKFNDDYYNTLRNKMNWKGNLRYK